MRFEVLTYPFEHIIIHDVFTPDQLTKVWSEIQFLHPRLVRVGVNGFDGGSAKDEQGNLLKQNSVISLNEVYNNQTSVSYILQYLADLFHSDELTNPSVNELGYYFKLYVKARTFYFKLQYYENNDGYESHTDVSVFTNNLFLYREPKGFTGGDFVFDEYDYTVSCETNKMVIFPSTIKHSVTSVKMLDDTPMSGRYSITTFQNIK